jgi:hypothetical protein
MTFQSTPNAPAGLHTLEESKTQLCEAMEKVIYQSAAASEAVPQCVNFPIFVHKLFSAKLSFENLLREPASGTCFGNLLREPASKTCFGNMLREPASGTHSGNSFRELASGEFAFKKLALGTCFGELQELASGTPLLSRTHF